MKALLTLLAATALLGCTPTPEEARAKEQARSEHYEEFIAANSVEVCIRGVKHLYLRNGNASHTILLVDPETSRVLPCEVKR